jgi:hypothetical protein
VEQTSAPGHKSAERRPLTVLGLEPVAGLPSIENQDIADTHVTDAGLASGQGQARRAHGFHAASAGSSCAFPADPPDNLD